MIFTRQYVDDLPSSNGNRYADALQTERGGYTVLGDAATADITLVGNGSEVSLLCKVAGLLEAAGVKASVASIPSIGLFLDQPEDYRNSIIPAGKPTFGLTAGLPSTLREVIGSDGCIYGLERFGASAPYKVLDEKFGFTPDAVYNRVMSYLGR